jgi:hypothetical protein
MKMSLDKKLLVAGALSASLLSGCASINKGTPDEAFNQLGFYDNKTTELKKEKKGLGNPFEYQASTLKSAYDAGYLHDLNNIENFSLKYGGLDSKDQKAAVLAGVAKSYPFESGIETSIANCLKSTDLKNCDKSYNNTALDSRMASYTGSQEYAMAEKWMGFGPLGDDISLAVWIAIGTAVYNHNTTSTAVCTSLGSGSSTSTIGDANTLGSLGGSTSSGSVPVGGQVVNYILPGKGC